MYLRWILTPAPIVRRVQPDVIGAPFGMSASAEGDNRFKVLLMESGRAPLRVTPRQRTVCYLGCVQTKRMMSQSHGWYYRSVFWEKVRRRLAKVHDPDERRHLQAELEIAVPPPPPELDEVVAKALRGALRGKTMSLNLRYHASDVPLEPVDLPPAAQRQIARKAAWDAVIGAWLEGHGPPAPIFMRAPDGEDSA
jgi:hypothetical protein